MLRPFLLAATLAALLGDVCLYGLWTNRWKNTRELEAAVARLSAVPREVGSWRGQDLALTARELQEAEIAGYLHRRYEDRRTKAAVTVLLVCGRAGPLSVHTPDICYRGSGYQGGACVHSSVDVGRPGNVPLFWAATFRKPQATAAALRIYWSWNARDRWEAPANPRLAFAGRPALYKLYLVRPMTSNNEQLEDDACKDFLRLFLPLLERSLFPGAGSV
jgi:hypothetical protein